MLVILIERRCQNDLLSRMNVIEMEFDVKCEGKHQAEKKGAYEFLSQSSSRCRKKCQCHSVLLVSQVIPVET